MARKSLFIDALCSVCTIVFVFFVGYRFYKFKSHENFKEAIPEGIEVRRVIAEGYDLTGPSDTDCGGIIFKLPKKTLNSINKNGLDFFYQSETNLIRGVTGSPPYINRYHTDHVYSPWKESPVPYKLDSIDYNSPLGENQSSLSCLDRINHKIVDDIKNKLVQKGSYYTQDKKGSQTYDLLVIPKLKIIVYTFHG